MPAATLLSLCKRSANRADDGDGDGDVAVTVTVTAAVAVAPS